MLCAKLATRKDGFQFPCGQCGNCRINNRRAWQARLLLEAACHEYASFITLTLQDVGTPSVLLRRYPKAFIRVLARDHDFRYFLAAEYGGKTGRAHYHVHLFSKLFIPALAVQRAWPFGKIHFGDSEPASLDYVLGYLLKEPSPWPIAQRYPEFRMHSQGLGKLALGPLLVDGTTLPREFCVFGRKWPIPRYLRDRAKKMGFTVSDTQTTQLEHFEQKALQALWANQTIPFESKEQALLDLYARRKARSAEQQKKAIRAAYMQAHGHLKRVKHETF